MANLRIVSDNAVSSATSVFAVPSEGYGPTLTLYGNAQVVGGVITKVGGAEANDSAAYSESYFTGSCLVKFKIPTGAGEAVTVGLALEHYSDNAWTTHDGYMFDVVSAGSIYAYSGGSHTGGSVGTVTSATELMIEYVGTTVRHIVDGVVVTTTSTTAGRGFFAAAVIPTPAAGVQLLRFSPSLTASGTCTTVGGVIAKPTGSGTWVG